MPRYGSAYYGGYVEPRPFPIGSIIDRLGQGYQFGRGMARDREERRRQRTLDEEHRQDRNRYLAALRLQDLERPGAMELTPELGKRQLAPEAGRLLASADVSGTPEEVLAGRTAFKPAGGRTSVLPGGYTWTEPDRSPYVTASGILIDPTKARQELTLANIMKEQADLRTRTPWYQHGFANESEYDRYQRSQRLKPYEQHGFATAADERAYEAGQALTPWERQGFKTEGALHKFERGSAEAGRAGAERKPPMSVREAIDAFDKLYGRWNAAKGMYEYDMPESERRRILQTMVGPNVVIPEPTPTAPAITAAPPAERERGGGGGFWSGLGKGLGEAGAGLSRAQAANRGGVVAPTRAPVTPEPNAPQAPTPPGAAVLPQPKTIEELRPHLMPWQVQRYERLIQEGRDPLDAIDQLAADEWDALVQSGVDAETATGMVSQKYGVKTGNE